MTWGAWLERNVGRLLVAGLVCVWVIALEAGASSAAARPRAHAPATARSARKLGSVPPRTNARSVSRQRHRSNPAHPAHVTRILASNSGPARHHDKSPPLRSIPP